MGSGGMSDLDQHGKEQFGVVSRAQVVDALGSNSSIRWRVETGDLERVNELVYRLRGSQLIWQRTAHEGLLMAGPGSMLSHRTAAWLHGLDGFKEPSVFDVGLAGGRGARDARFVFHRATRGFGEHVRGPSFMPITTVQRTLVDLAAELTNEQLEIALDSAQRRYRPYFLSWLEPYLASLNPRCTPGLSELKLLLDVRGDFVTDSPLEVRVRRILRKAGLEPKGPPHIVEHHGVYVIRLDFAWPELKVGVHCDSYRWHSQRERIDRDARQRSMLEFLNWRCITVTETTLKEGVWLDQLKALLSNQRELSLGV